MQPPRFTPQIVIHAVMLRLRQHFQNWIENPDVLRRTLRDSPLGQVIACVFLGGAVGLLISLLHRFILLGHKWFFVLQAGDHLSAAHHVLAVKIFLVPVLGGLAIGLYYLLVKRWRPHEIVDPIEANAIFGGRMSVVDSLRLLIAAFISNITGLSIGMEAGYTQIGSGMMSWVGRRLQLRREDIRTFVAAGAAAAIAAAFNAPLAGAFYGFELVLSSYTINALLPVAVSALSSALYVRIFTRAEPIFSLPLSVANIPFWNYPFFVAIGIASALLGIFTMRLVTRCEHIVRHLPVQDWLRPALGGALFSIIALAFPQVLGSGQGAIDAHLHEQWTFIGLIILLAAKILASAISIGSGFRGGLFSSSLFIGCLLGQAMGIVASVVLPETGNQMEGFMLVGIGSVAASIIGAPITMVLLVLELTGNFPTTTGVLAGVLVASAITRYYFGYSFSTWRFHLRGLRIQGAHDIGWISDLTVSKLMRTGLQIVPESLPLADLRKIAPAGSTKRVFVVDERGHYQGLVDMAAVHNPDLDKTAATLPIKDLAKGKNHFLFPPQNIRYALERFTASEMEELPVLASASDPKVIGYVTEAYALRRYTQELETRNLAQSGTGVPAEETKIV